MSKRVSRGRRETHKTRRAARSTRTVPSVRSADPASHDTGSVHHRLARLLDSPLLARVVPHLAPETLHQLIRYADSTPVESSSMWIDSIDAVVAILQGHTGAVSATAFEFISRTGQIREVRAFMGKLLDALLR